MIQKFCGFITPAHLDMRWVHPTLLAVMLSCTLGLAGCNGGSSTADSPSNPGTNDDIETDPGSGNTETGSSTDDGLAELWQPAPGTTWMWQLTDYDNLNMDLAVEVYDIDLFEGMENGTNSLIRQLKNNGKRVICYFSAGTREDWRPDADQFTPGSVIADGEMDDWPGETWLNIGDQAALEQTIEPIMEARLDLAAHAGCDAVEPDNVDGYANTDETRGAISAADQLAYNKWLAQAAHARGLSIGLKNDLGQLEALLDHFDFAVNEQCYAYGNECVNYENTFLSIGKAVFNQEYYEGGAEGEIAKDRFIDDACPYFLNTGISSLWKTGFNLDGREVIACNG